MVGDQYVTFYLSADNPLIKALPLFELVYDLYMQYGVRYLVIDEIQKADDWTNHLKAIVDSFPDLLLVASGSSALDLYKGTADLQRRVHGVMLYPLSFVEYMRFTKGIELPSISFEQLLSDHQAIAFQHSHDVDMGDVQAYLSHGLYPYFALRKPIYHSLLLQNIKKTILEDIPTFMNIQTKSLAKIEKLFYFIANIPPSDLSYHALSKKIGISNDLLETIVYYLDQIGVINLAIRSNKTSDIMRKEFKIFLGNPNIVAAYQDQNNR